MGVKSGDVREKKKKKREEKKNNKNKNILFPFIQAPVPLILSSDPKKQEGEN